MGVRGSLTDDYYFFRILTPPRLLNACKAMYR